EVDGGQHVTDPRDLIRDRWLRDHNYRVLRFWNNDVLTKMEGVLETILSALRAILPLTRIAPRSDLSPQAGRGKHRKRRGEGGEIRAPLHASRHHDRARRLRGGICKS